LASAGSAARDPITLAAGGCPWRFLPKNFPLFSTVQNRFCAWHDSGRWVEQYEAGSFDDDAAAAVTIQAYEARRRRHWRPLLATRGELGRKAGHAAEAPCRGGVGRAVAGGVPVDGEAEALVVLRHQEKSDTESLE
jgi:hypothetical protein